MWYKSVIFIINMKRTKGQEVKSLDFFQHMTEEDLVEVVEMGDMELFCNALTLDIQDLQTGKVFNQA